MQSAVDPSPDDGSRAPLAVAYEESPLWHVGVDLPAAAREHRPLPATADVVVVGGGYCGVSAAWQLARRGRHAVVLEADALGTGASTRNGGMVIPELKCGPRALTRRYGPLGGELLDSVLDAFELVERLVVEHRIECDYERTGGMLLAHHEAQVPALREAAAEWAELGEDARFVAREELHEEVGSGEYHAGFVLEKTAGLQPAKYHAGLVRLALDAGADLHGHTRARGLEHRGTGCWLVHTDRGDIEAADVLVATNAYADDLVPALARRVLPIGSFIIATEVLDPDLAAQLIPRRRMLYDTKNFLFYWRLSPDNRMVFGGRTSFARTTVSRARDVLYSEMVRVHPLLRNVRVTHAWTGNVALTFDRLPHCGRIDGVAYATGCNGTGIALATWLGTRAAAWLSGEEPPPPFAELSFPAIPLHGSRDAWLGMVGAWFRARDRLGR